MIRARFLIRQQFSFSLLSRKWILLSLLLGLGVAIGFWTFLVVISELVPHLKFHRPFNKLITIDPSLRFQWYWTLAGYATLLGNTVFFALLFQRNRKLLLRNADRRRILNDQVFLLPNFLYLFLKVGFLMGFFLILTNGDDLRLWFMPIALLSMIALYLESIKSLNRVIGKSRFKFMGIHFVVLVLLSLGVSQIPLRDFSKLETAYNEKNPRVEVPVLDFDSSNFEPDSRGYTNLKMKLFPHPEGYVLKVLDSSYVNADENTLWESVRSYYRPETPPRLMIYVDRSMSMERIRKFELLLFELNIPKIKYVWQDAFGEEFNVERAIIYDKSEGEEVGSRQLSPLYPPPPPNQVIERISINEKLSLQLTARNVFSAVGEIEKENVYGLFSEAVKNKKPINFVYTDDLSFQRYMELYVLYHKAVYDLRSLELPFPYKYQFKGYLYLGRKDRKALDWAKNKYPMLWVDNYK